jgi:hypothetical protein
MEKQSGPSPSMMKNCVQAERKVIESKTNTLFALVFIEKNENFYYY